MSIEGRENGSANLFEDFQSFAEWCQGQYGYLKKNPSGKYWHIEKDMRVLGNKSYSPETCMFVPEEVNSLLNFFEKDSDLYYGVILDTESDIRKKKFKASCKGGRPVSKRFYDPLEGHIWWLSQKISIISDLILKYEEHTVLRESLERIIEIFKYHVEEGKPLKTLDR